MTTVPRATTGTPPDAATQPTLLRLALPDRPGALASVTRCLAACGVDILAVEVVSRRGGEAVDDLLVSGGDLDRAVRALEGEVRVLGRRAGGALPDPALLMAEALAGVLAAPSLDVARQAMVAAAVGLCGASSGVLLRPAGEDGGLAAVAATVEDVGDVPSYEPSLARRALRAGAPVVARGADSWAPARQRERMPGHHVLALPVGGEPPLVLVVVRADDVPFVDAEVERLQALLRVVVSGAPGR